MRYIIRLSYDGSAFCGWQVQPNAVTVQEKLEKALSLLLRTSINVTGAGRTDTAVNAIGYAAHFDCEEPLDARSLSYKINAILPREIVVHSIEPAAPGFHARFAASRREYTYFLHKKKDPFAESFSLRYGYPVDVEAMNEAARALLGRHDFSCFEKVGADNHTSICTVSEAHWEKYVPAHAEIMNFCSEDGDYMYFRIAADRFLRNMVRAIVGSLLEVGRGRRTVEEFRALVLPVTESTEKGCGGKTEAEAGAASTGGESAAAGNGEKVTAESGRKETGGSDAGKANRCRAGESVPGHALFLSKVEY